MPMIDWEDVHHIECYQYRKPYSRTPSQALRINYSLGATGNLFTMKAFACDPSKLTVKQDELIEFLETQVPKRLRNIVRNIV